MPSYGRRRRVAIVVPVSRAQEISGGLKNALDRGETLAKAKQSFINAGYTPQEVSAAVQMIRSNSKETTPQSTTQSNPNNPIQPIPSKQTPKTDSKKTIIILSIISVVVLVAALLLGLFWDKIF